MSDIAELGFSIPTGDIKNASDALDKLQIKIISSIDEFAEGEKRAASFSKSMLDVSKATNSISPSMSSATSSSNELISSVNELSSASISLSSAGESASKKIKEIDSGMSAAQQSAEKLKKPIGALDSDLQKTGDRFNKNASDAGNFSGALDFISNKLGVLIPSLAKTTASSGSLAASFFNMIGFANGAREVIEQNSRKIEEFGNKAEKAGDQVKKASAANKEISESSKESSASLNLFGVSGIKLNAITSSMGRIAITAAKGLGLVGAAAGAALIPMNALAQSQDAYNLQNARTETILKKTNYAVGQSTESLERMASALALATLESVSGVQEAQRILLTYRKIQGDTFQEALELSADFAVILGQPISSSARLVGRSLEFPMEAVGALKESVGEFDPVQVRMIENFVKTGKTAEAQRIIIDKLKTSVGGLAVAGGSTLAFSVDTLSQKWDEFKRRLGETLTASETFIAVTNKLANAIDYLDSKLNKAPKTIEEMGKEYAEQFAKLAAINEKIAKLEVLPRGQKRPLGAGHPLMEERAQIEAELKKREKALREATEKENNIRRKSEEERKKIEERDKNESARIIAEENQAILDAIESRVRTEQDLIDRSHQEIIKKIMSLTLTEQQIRAAGFKTMNELRQSFINEEKRKYDEETQAIIERERERREKIERERIDQEQAPLKELSQRYVSERDSLISQTESPAEKDRRMHEERIRIFQEFAQKIPALEAQANEMVERERKRHAEFMKQIDDEQTTSRLSVAHDFFSNVSSLMDTGNKRMFRIGKVAAASTAALSMVEGISRSLGAYPMPWAAAVAAGHAALGAAQLMKIKNMQFGGGAASASLNATTPSMPNVRRPEGAPAPQGKGEVLTGDNRVTIINQTTGRIDAVEETKGFNGERALILRETSEFISNEIENPNSKISRSLQRNFTTGRSR